MLPRPLLLDIGVRWALACALLLALAVSIGHPYVQLWLPFYKPLIAVLLPDYRITALTLAAQPAGHVVAVTLELTHATWIGVKLLPVGFSVSSSTLEGHALQHLVIIGSLLLAWPLDPQGGWSHRIALLLLGFISLAVVEALDIPFVLAGSVTDLLMGNFAPALLDESWRVRWMNFLNGGGRLVLSVAAVLMAVAAYRRLFPRHADVSQTSSELL